MKNPLCSELLKLKNDSCSFFEKLIEIYRNEINSENKTLSQALIKINNEHDLDLLAVASKAIENGSDFWTIQHILQDVIPDLNINIKTTLAFIKTTYERIQRDRLAGIQYTPFEKLAENQPSISEKLLAAIENTNEIYATGYISALYVGLSKQNPDQTYQELISINLEKDSIPAIQAKLHALGRLDYTKKLDSVDNVISLIDDIMKKEIIETYGAIIQTLGSLLKYSDEPVPRLLSFTDKQDQDINYFVSCVLLSVQKEKEENDWFDKLFLKLSITKCNFKGTIDNIDCILQTILRKNNKPTIVNEFLDAWIKNSDYHSEKISIDKLYNSTIPELLNRIELRNLILTNYFNSDEHVFHKAAKQFVDYLRIREVTSLQLDYEIIKKLNQVDLLYISRKILGYVVDAKILCSLIYSILEAKPNDKESNSLVYTIFIRHIGAGYPTQTIEFLQNKLSSLDNTDPKKNVVNQVIKYIQNRRKAYDNLPKLKELVIAKQLVRQVSIARQKNINEAMEQAQSESVFAQFTTEVPLKYPTGWFSYINGEYCQPRKLTSYSKNIEVPWTEISQPVSSAIDRRGFRIANRGDQ